MIICNQEFNFSALNADDIDRMEAASKQQISRAKAEAKRLGQENASYSDILRSQCRVLMDYFDAVLGDGASQRLGLTGSDLGKCTQVATEFKAVSRPRRARLWLLSRYRWRRRATVHSAVPSASIISTSRP